jgi:hypothetical protein
MQLSLEFVIPSGARDRPDPIRSLDASGTDASHSLADRLFRLGLAPGTPVTVTRNRTVLISWRARSGLRLHAGYVAAPDHVLSAIVQFVSRWAPRTERGTARRAFMSFPVEQYAPSRPERPRAPRAVPLQDQPVIDRLNALRAAFNERHFAGALAAIPIRLSHRMRSRLGELRASQSGAAVEITISRRHIRRDGWNAVADTLMHEMVHQWQAANGHPLDHGREFRRKAREVGISPRAVADLSSPRRNS